MVDNSNYQNIVEERVGPVPTGSNLITQTCLAYLLQFDSPRDFGKTLTVDFAFLNYAVYYWLDHLETCISEKPSQTTLQMVSDFTISNQVPFANVAAIYARHSLPLGHEAEPMCGSPLYWAAHFGMSKVCGLLVVEGADINAFDAILGTPISAAIRRGHNAIVHILVNNGAELEPIDRVSPLHIACSSLNSEAVKLVLNSKVDVNAVGSQRMSALALAASAGEDGKIIQLLLDAGANVNEPTERENSALRRACERWVLHEYNDTAMMLLLNHGAVVPDGEEKTLLEAAVKSDDVHAIQLLVGSGVDVNIGIHAAAVFGKDLNVGLLHDLGANIDHIGGRYETTALCEAAYQGHENVVRRLLSHGAELDMQDKHGWITGEIASVQGHDHLITALPAPNLKARDSISTHKRPSHLILPAGSPSELTIHSDGITVSAELFVSQHIIDRRQVRANHPAPHLQDIFYYEVEIIHKGKASSVGIGFCEASSPHNGMPGWDQGSWGYHANDGVKFGSRATLAQYGPIYGTGDIVGCGFEYNTRSIFFTENGEHLGIAFTGVPGILFPVLATGEKEMKACFNFGAKPFVY